MWLKARLISLPLIERPIYITDAQTDARFQYGEHAREEGIVSVVVVPLQVQNQPIGVMRVYTSEERGFSEPSWRSWRRLPA